MKKQKAMRSCRVIEVWEEQDYYCAFVVWTDGFETIEKLDRQPRIGSWLKL